MKIKDILFTALTSNIYFYQNFLRRNNYLLNLFLWNRAFLLSLIAKYN